jgi:putative ABC transport system permease protein
MNLISLVWNYLKAKPFNTALNILLLSLGVGVITILLLFNNQLQEKIAQNAKGIDLVVGAKGSPLQLILCNIFHVDFPTGNIKLRDAERIVKNRMIKRSIPLALGDSFRGFRIVGTSTGYADLYHAELSEGTLWKNDMEVTLGSNCADALKLRTGDRFISTHGLASEGHAHENAGFIVKGILRRSNSVIDNLILTSIESIWHLHETHGMETDSLPHGDQSTIGSPASLLVPTVQAGDSVREITSLLIQYRSAMAAVQLPRVINGQSSLQAASPAFESARLFSIMGVGVDILNAFAYILIIISALSIFIALYNSLKERKYDLAMMRVMGASRAELLVSVILEGTGLTLIGTAVGMLLGHGAVGLMSLILPQIAKAGISGFAFYSEEWIILVGSLLLGILCSIIPAFSAYRTDISKVLGGSQ